MHQLRAFTKLPAKLYSSKTTKLLSNLPSNLNIQPFFSYLLSYIPPLTSLVSNLYFLAIKRILRGFIGQVVCKMEGEVVGAHQAEEHFAV